MRPALLVASASVALAHLVAAASPHLVSAPPATVLSSPSPLAAAAPNQSISTGPHIETPSRPSTVDTPTCCTATHLSSNSLLSVAQPNATASQAAELTGGAIPQQMQASVVGLLGFCIMGLVML